MEVDDVSDHAFSKCASGGSAGSVARMALVVTDTSRGSRVAMGVVTTGSSEMLSLSGGGFATSGLSVGGLVLAPRKQLLWRLAQERICTA